MVILNLESGGSAPGKPKTHSHKKRKHKPPIDICVIKHKYIENQKHERKNNAKQMAGCAHTVGSFYLPGQQNETD